jgi:hypothetical protein
MGSINRDDQHEHAQIDPPEPFPQELLDKPASARQYCFDKEYIEEHERLTTWARDTVLRHICPLGNDTAYRIRAKTILVIGPPRVGKTTLIGLITEKFAERASMAMEQDKGYIPYVAITLESSDNSPWLKPGASQATAASAAVSA